MIVCLFVYIGTFKSYVSGLTASTAFFNVIGIASSAYSIYTENKQWDNIVNVSNHWVMVYTVTHMKRMVMFPKLKSIILNIIKVV